MVATGAHVYIGSAMSLAAEDGEGGLQDVVAEVVLEVVGDGLAEGGAVHLGGKGAGVGAREPQREHALVDV